MGVEDLTGLVVTFVGFAVFCVLTTNINRKEIAIESDGIRDKDIKAPWWGQMVRRRNCIPTVE